jgi:hypothetical protein
MVLLEKDDADETDDGVLGGKDADDLGAPLDLAVAALDRLVPCGLTWCWARSRRGAGVRSLDAGIKSRVGEGTDVMQEATMRKGRLSVAGLSILFALGLAAWEVYFFWLAGSFKSMDGTLGLFTPDRLGFNMAWLAAVYLTFQLISIPFSLPSGGNRFIGVVDGLASLVPLAVVLIVVFGKPQLLGTTPRWEAACLLIFVTAVDLFGGYTFNIALGRRTMDFAPAAPA